MMIATHGRNLRGSSNMVLYLEAVIYNSPLLYCCETELTSFHSFVEADFCAWPWYVLFYSRDYHKSIFGPCYKMQHSQKSQQHLITNKGGMRFQFCNAGLDPEGVDCENVSETLSKLTFPHHLQTCEATTVPCYVVCSLKHIQFKSPCSPPVSHGQTGHQLV